MSIVVGRLLPLEVVMQPARLRAAYMQAKFSSIVLDLLRLI